MKRAVAVAEATMEAVNAIQATLIQERKDRRGNSFLFAGAFGGFFASGGT
jgi:hypothetical protein